MTMPLFKPTHRVAWLLIVLCVLGWFALLGLAQDATLVLPAWEPQGAEVQDATAALSLPQMTVAPRAPVTVPLTLTLTQGQVYSADIAVTYDPNVITATAVDRGALAAGWSLASNLATPGVVRVALAGATPITTSGELLLFIFGAIGQAGSGTNLTLTRGDLNEGSIPTTLQHGYLCVLFGDFDGDSKVTVNDIQAVASHWRQRAGDPGWEARFDVNGDGVINIVDIMLVAARWGESCQ
jgi:hypothetical protein